MQVVKLAIRTNQQTSKIESAFRPSHTITDRQNIVQQKETSNSSTDNKTEQNKKPQQH